MFAWIVILFVTLPLVELALLMRVARVIDIGPTIGLVVITGALGAWLARKQGLTAWRRVQTELAEGHMPTSGIIDGLLILVAGVLLITPGIITDSVGFCFLIPPVRVWVRRRLANHFRDRVFTVTPPNDGVHEIIDVEVTEVGAETGSKES